MAEPFELRTADQILAMLDNGDFLLAFLADHQDLILSLHNHQMTQGGKASGSFTLKVSYTLDKQLAMHLTGDAKFDKPKKPKAAATLWTTADGMLTPQNPRQPSLPGIRDVTSTSQAMRSPA